MKQGLGNPRSGVFLLAHGAPERVEDVEAYLTFVRGGRPASPQILKKWATATKRSADGLPCSAGRANRRQPWSG